MGKSELPKRIAFLGNYLPRLCGIATFTHDLCEAVSASAPAAHCYVGAVNDREEGYDYPPRVRLELLEKDVDSYRRAADFINFDNADVLCVQHEFGIYGGQAGSHLLALLSEVRMPVVTTLHTIPLNPNPSQRKVMNELVQRSDRIVVMAHKGAEILTSVYAVPRDKIDIIAHGIPDIQFSDSQLSKAQFGVEGNKVLLTFGLLGPGKGIEYVIEAMPEIIRRHPNVVYLVLGATHPHLVAREGEAYRLSLERLAEDRGVKDHVIFYNRFVSHEDLVEFIGATDIYITPYLNEDQITSGTLAYVFGAGKAVVSTPYWHARELLDEGRGTLVPFKDPAAIAGGVCDYLDQPERMESTRREAYRLGRDMIWPAVAAQYMGTFKKACADRPAAGRTAFARWTLDSRPYDLPLLRLDHIMRMSDGTGIFQHALFNVPDFHHGYCIDDNARAFILCNLLEELDGTAQGEKIDRLATTYLAFIASALHPDSKHFRNFMSFSRLWLEDAGSEDSHGRTMWALGTGVGRSRNEGHRRLSQYLFDHGLTVVDKFSSPRAWASTLLGVHEYLAAFPDNAAALAQRAALTNKLIRLFQQYATDNWPWFEKSATYDNARLCQSLIISGRLLQHDVALEIGLKTLRWLVSIQTTQRGHFRPIGSNGFYRKGRARADFDQQPLEAQAMVAACLEAFRATQDARWSFEARRVFEWFLGRNDLGLALYDPRTGGCNDGLHSDRVNENQGAESSLAFHLALAEMKYAQHPLPSL